MVPIPGMKLEDVENEKGQWIAVLDEEELAEELPQFDKRMKVEVDLVAAFAAAA